VRELGGSAAPRRSPGDALRSLADEQSALRRLAAAVARGVSPDEMFTAVADEMAPLLGADEAAVVRFEPDATATFVGGVGEWVDQFGMGVRTPLEDSLVVTTVFRTGRSTRFDRHDYNGASSQMSDYLRRKRYRTIAASPIVVEGRRWGAMVVATSSEPLPPDTEERLANVTELVGIVIANAESRAELTASRARVAAAADEARRRIQRDLHDGAQQRLVTAVMTLKMARQALQEGPEPAAVDGSRSAVELLDQALVHAEGANRDLRELAHGILPAALSHGGLRGAIDALVSRVHLPVSSEVTGERLPASLEAAAYFIVAEALTNTVRHAQAETAQIVALVDAGVLRLMVRDDGVGGAPPDGGSGLLGLRDRAAALGGQVQVESPPGEGTVVAATLPIPA
jgi:signal transduction histidine kinase